MDTFTEDLAKNWLQLRQGKVYVHFVGIYHVCIDIAALSSAEDKERLIKEVSIMLSFQHPNVMSLIGLCFDEEVPLLIMPFMLKGTVLKYVKENREFLYFINEELDKSEKVWTLFA